MVKKRSKGDEYILLYPEKVDTFKAHIINLVIKILREHPLQTEKEIIFQLITNDPFAKEYVKKKNTIAYFRYIIWEMARKKMILRAKILGDRKHTYFFLPDQLDMLKNRIVRAPRRE